MFSFKWQSGANGGLQTKVLQQMEQVLRNISPLLYTETHLTSSVNLHVFTSPPFDGPLPRHRLMLDGIYFYLSVLDKYLINTTEENQR